MDLLITFDANYVEPFKVMLHSFFASNPGEKSVTFYLLHSQISGDTLQELEEDCASYGASLVSIAVDPALFGSAPTKKRYPKEMYYRLLSPLILPRELKRVLYLDPDILIINPLRPLWELDMQGNVFAAASHTGLTEMSTRINGKRLNINHQYFNTGVMLMDLEKARALVTAEEVFRCVEAYANELILPDQDVFNILYGGQTLAIDDAVWNYDVRNYSKYAIRSEGVRDLNWVMGNTAILHFCGKNKPWDPDYNDLFGALYKHYGNLTARKTK